MKISVFILLSIVVVVSFAQQTVGGISQSDLNSLSNNYIFQKCDQAVREEFQRKYNNSLEGITSVRSQVVAGTKYYITYNYKGKSVDAGVVSFAGERKIEVTDITINNSKKSTLPAGRYVSALRYTDLSLDEIDSDQKLKICDYEIRAIFERINEGAKLGKILSAKKLVSKDLIYVISYESEFGTVDASSIYGYEGSEGALVILFEYNKNIQKQPPKQQIQIKPFVFPEISAFPELLNPTPTIGNSRNFLGIFSNLGNVNYKTPPPSPPSQPLNPISNKFPNPNIIHPPLNFQSSFSTEFPVKNLDWNKYNQQWWPKQSKQIQNHYPPFKY